MLRNRIYINTIWVTNNIIIIIDVYILVLKMSFINASFLVSHQITITSELLLWKWSYGLHSLTVCKIDWIIIILYMIICCEKYIKLICAG